jgi:hypothetical protein
MHPLRVTGLAALLAVALSGCFGGVFEQPWHETRLPSGKVKKVTQFMLVWGVEHDERHVEQDCLALEFASDVPDAEPAVREQEALEVFELMRPTSELWGFRTATIAAFRSTERKGHYDLFVFTRAGDGSWSHEVIPSKVFANE